MPIARPYGDGCATAHAAELIGERWSLLVVRELLLGPKRFADLERGLPRVSPTVLSQRLRELEASGVLQRQRLGPPARVSVYELTEWGRELEPIVLSLARWASRSTSIDRDAELSADSLMLHMRARYPRAAAGLHGCYEIRLGEDRFTVDVTDDELTVHRGTATTPDAMIETDPATLTALLRGRSSLDDAISRNRARLEGASNRVDRLLAACSFQATS